MKATGGKRSRSRAAPPIQMPQGSVWILAFKALKDGCALPNGCHDMVHQLSEVKVGTGQFPQTHGICGPCTEAESEIENTLRTAYGESVLQRSIYSAMVSIRGQHTRAEPFCFIEQTKAQSLKALIAGWQLCCPGNALNGLSTSSIRERSCVRVRPGRGLSRSGDSVWDEENCGE